jgi:uncharacterized protein
MRWRQTRESDNIEDRRGMPVGAAGAGIGAVGLIVVLAIALLTHQDPVALLNEVAQQGGGAAPSATQEFSPEEQQAATLVSEVLASTEDTWGQVLPDQTQVAYVRPKLVLFTGQVDSACGTADTAVGPFYCPNDQKVYLDLSFFDELTRRFGAPGDFARAYVVAHEIGHHVENLTGILPQVDAERQRVGKTEANRLSVALELMADCLAGVWANKAQQTNLILDQTDVEAGLNAASAVGDDRLQMQAQGYVVPDAFTHGTSKQRVDSFMRGLKDGSIQGCNTFGGN